MADFVNIHTHKGGEGICIVDRTLNDGKGSGNKVYYSWGIHPLFADENAAGNLAHIEEAAKSGLIAAIGESGLDRNAPLSLPLQEELLERQIGLSEKYRLPLIIHCVRAFPELLSLRLKTTPRQPWIIHGYNNNGEILAGLLRHGCYLSGGRQLMDDQSNIRKLLNGIPLERLFLETDDSDFTISGIYTQASDTLGITMEALKEAIFTNFLKTFKTSF